MAGALIVDEIKSGVAAPPVVKNANGAVIGEFCRARWSVNSTTAAPTVRDSFNVSSLTDVGVGLIAANFTVALADVNYSLSGACSTNGTDTNGYVFGVGYYAGHLNAPAAGAVETRTMTVAGANSDAVYLTAAVFGD